MPRGLNKKILCFIDEHGTAGSNDFNLGVLVVLSSDAGRVDKTFSDLLPASAAEIHPSKLGDRYVKSLMQRFAQSELLSRVVMLNRKVATKDETGDPPLVYASAVVETTKIALKRFQKNVLVRENIGNVELLLDANHHNTHKTFDEAVARAQHHEGKFKAVRSIAKIDSAASRLLQMADVVAYSRQWVVRDEINAQGMREQFGIEVSS